MNALPLLRLTVHVPRAHGDDVRARYGIEDGSKALAADVARRLERIGYPNALAVTVDPTEPTIATALARPRAPVKASDGTITVVGTTLVDEPSSRDGVARSSFDVGTRADDDELLRRALDGETNPRHLDGIASSFEPCFPVSASLLRAKAMLLELRAEHHRREANAHNAGLRLPFVATVMPTGYALADLTRRHARWAEVETMWRELADSADCPQAWRRLPTATPQEAKQAGVDLARFERETGEPHEPLRDRVRTSASRIADQPLQRLYFPVDEPPNDLVGKLARTCVVDVGLGVRVVCPTRLRLVLPPEPRDGFVSNTALKLANGLMKPRWSGIRNEGRLSSLQSDLTTRRRGEDERVRLRAVAQMRRADSALDRRRWIEWYRRADAMNA